MRPWRPPFHASPATRKGPISSKWVSSQDPLLRKFGNFGLYRLNLHPNFSSQAPNLEIFSSQAPKFRNFQLTSPQIWEFSTHKTPFSEVNVSSQAPHFGNPGRTPLSEKSSVPPPPGLAPPTTSQVTFYSVFPLWTPPPVLPVSHAPSAKEDSIVSLEKLTLEVLIMWMRKCNSWFIQLIKSYKFDPPQVPNKISNKF